jgi:predicted HTH domain antitoxin
MASLRIEYPPELAAALGKRAPDAEAEIRLMAALKLFESGRISSGLAAKLAGLDRAEFLLQCGQHGVSAFQQTAAEIGSDAEAALDASNR